MQITSIGVFNWIIDSIFSMKCSVLCLHNIRFLEKFKRENWTKNLKSQLVFYNWLNWHKYRLQYNLAFILYFLSFISFVLEVPYRRLARLFYGFNWTLWPPACIHNCRVHFIRTLRLPLITVNAIGGPSFVVDVKVAADGKLGAQSTFHDDAIINTAKVVNATKRFIFTAEWNPWIIQNKSIALD